MSTTCMYIPDSGIKVFALTHFLGRFLNQSFKLLSPLSSDIGLKADK